MLVHQVLDNRSIQMKEKCGWMAVVLAPHDSAPFLFFGQVLSH
jgi:hypothetical protein